MPSSSWPTSEMDVVIANAIFSVVCWWLVAASSAGPGGAQQVRCLRPHHSQGCAGWRLPAPSSASLGIRDGQGGIYFPLCFCGAGLGCHHRGSTQMWDVPPHSIGLLNRLPDPGFPLLPLL